MRIVPLLICACASMPLALAVPHFTVVDLGKGVPTGINANGTIIGIFGGGETGPGIIYPNGVIASIPGDPDFQPLAINAAGDIVGTMTSPDDPNGDDDDDDTPPLGLYHAGTLTAIPAFVDDSEYQAISAINSSDVITGYVSEDSYSAAYVYQNGGWTSLLPRDLVEAMDINDAGQIVGAINDGPGRVFARAFLLDHGKLTHLLGPFPGYPKIADAEAFSINNRGTILGNFDTTKGVDRAFLYSSGRYTVLEPPGHYTETSPIALNDAGQVVGTLDPSTGTSPFLYDSGQVIPLQSLVLGSAWKVTQVMDINDAGQIVGVGRNAAGQEHALLLNPPAAIFVAEGKATTTRHPTITIHGTTSGAISRIDYRVGRSGRFKPAEGQNSWRFTARLQTGKNVVMLKAYGPTNLLAAKAQVTVTRK